MYELSRDINEDFRISESLGHIVNRAAIIIRKKLAAGFKDAGVELTPEEFAILSRLWEEDGLYQTELTEKTLKDKTRVTRLLGNLIDKSFVEKKTDENDRRSYRIFITEKGRDHKSIVLPIVKELMEQASRHVSPEDMQTTIKTLKLVFENVNQAAMDCREAKGVLHDESV